MQDVKRLFNRIENKRNYKAEVCNFTSEKDEKYYVRLAYILKRESEKREAYASLKEKFFS